jgi:carbamoyltransferase
MYVLGIHAGHNSTATLLKEGKIIGSVSEERFVRIKNYWGFPLNSVKYLLDSEKITSKDLSLIVLGTKVITNITGRQFDMFKTVSAKKGFLKEVFSLFTYKYPSLTESLIQFKNFSQNSSFYEKKVMKYTADYVSKILGIKKEKIFFIDHHLAHAYSAGFNLPRDKKSLVFSIDGEGDESTCATVNIFDGKIMKRIAETKKRALYKGSIQIKKIQRF